MDAAFLQGLVQAVGEMDPAFLQAMEQMGVRSDRENALAKDIHHGCFTKVKGKLAAGDDPNATGEVGPIHMSMLEFAVNNADWKMALLLFAYGASPDQGLGNVFDGLIPQMDGSAVVDSRFADLGVIEPPVLGFEGLRLLNSGELEGPSLRPGNLNQPVFPGAIPPEKVMESVLWLMEWGDGELEFAEMITPALTHIDAVGQAMAMAPWMAQAAAMPAAGAIKERFRVALLCINRTVLSLDATGVPSPVTERIFEAALLAEFWDLIHQVGRIPTHMKAH